jgi:hypothetical protein
MESNLLKTMRILVVVPGDRVPHSHLSTTMMTKHKKL